ncbi:inner membrane CreD family protein, partial [Pseudomonas otitidis]
GFFLVEVLKRINVHPVQYGLVGLALAFFYLLLLSLSEHPAVEGLAAVLIGAVGQGLLHVGGEEAGLPAGGEA